MRVMEPDHVKSHCVVCLGLAYSLLRDRKSSLILISKGQMSDLPLDQVDIHPDIG